MQRVVHVSLHGNAFALEEGGHAALREYLDRAAAALAADPDRDEIVADLEQAIADKFARALGPHKTVVTGAEVAQVLAEMGPVGQSGAVGPDQAPAAAPATEPPPRRLYRILEGGVLGGLCNGLGAYLKVDANVVRAVFVVLALVTHGAWALVYLVLLFVIPAAGTSEERAAARGIPFSAQALVDGALRQYRKLEAELSGPWGRFRGTVREEWRRGWREARGQAPAAGAATAGAGGWGAPAAPEDPASPPATPPAPVAPPPPTYGRQLAAGMVMPLLAAVSAGVTVAWAVASASLVQTGGILGWNPPTLPLWGGLLVLAFVAASVGGPFQAARRSLRRWPHGAGGLLAAWDALLWLGFFAAFAWLAWTVSADLRDVLHDLPGAVEKVRASWHPHG